jgi:hypothetical protein
VVKTKRQVHADGAWRTANEAALLSAVGLAGEAMAHSELLELRAQLVAHHDESRRIIEQFDAIVALVCLSFNKEDLQGQV